MHHAQPNGGVRFVEGYSLEQNMADREKRRCTRVRYQSSAEFQLPLLGDVWFAAEVLDLSVTGVRLRFSPHQAAGVLKESDVEWQDVRLKFKDVEEDLVLNGHFLMVYDREGGLFTTGLEFTDVTMEQQFKLVMLYARYRKDAER